MNITCEHCGSTIDIDKDKVCPNCGAPYSNNKEYKEVKEYHKKEKEIKLKEKETTVESRQLANQVFQSTIKGRKIFGLISGIIMLGIIAFVVFTIFRHEEKPAVIPEYNGNNIQKEEQTVEVSFNESAQTESFDIKCDKVSDYKYDYFEKKEYKNSDNKVYNFHIVFQNKVNRLSILDTISLTYTDNKGNENVSAKKVHANVDESKNSLDIVTRDTLTHKGNIAFEIPKYVKDVKLVYEDVTININNFKDKM